VGFFDKYSQTTRDSSSTDLKLNVRLSIQLDELERSIDVLNTNYD
jgi:hypothetical protein